ncbi:TonB-dependent receptor [Flavobacteriaceae bacterium S0862]|nr:TonB-dependent receptor [Flavobacteriaceae bacterium S0862]
MKSIYLSLLFLVASLPIHAQNTVKGTITDIDTHEVLELANVYFPILEKGGITNENGEFTIYNIPNGKHKIIVSIIGYETYDGYVELPNEDYIKIQLYASAIEMDEIVLSTPFHKLQRDNVMKVDQKKISELKSNGAVTLADGINTISGVETVSTGIGIGKPVIRGLSSNRVLVYAQGVRLENQQYGDEHGLGLSDAGVESIEVIKGPASLLYGSDALGGVLYINPEKFANANSSKGDINFNYFTNTQGYNTNAGFKTSGEIFKAIFRGSLTEHSDYKTKDYRVTNSRFKEQDFKAAIGLHTSKFNTEIRYNLNASQLGIPEEIGVQSTSTTPLEPNQNINNHILSSKSKLFLENSSFELNFGYIFNDRKEFEDHHHEEDEEEEEGEEHEEGEEAALHMKLKTFNYDLKYNLPKSGKFETIVGIQGMTQTNSNFGEEELIPDATTNDIGLLATSHIHFDAMDLQIGARYDNRTINVDNSFDKSFSSFNGAFGIKKDFSESFTTRVNLASGFRAPNLAELTSDGSHEGTNRYEVGNENLKNEQNFQIDVAFEYNAQHVELFVNGFYNKVNNFIFLSPDGTLIDDNPVYLYLQDDAKLFGGELGLHFHPHPLDKLHIENTFETVTGKLKDGSHLPLIPANKITNTIRLEFENDWIEKGYSFIRLSTYLKQNNISDFETSTPSYALVNVGIGGEMKLFNNSLQLSISGNNLMNKKYVNHLSRLKSDGIYNIGRNVSFALSYTL